MWFNRGGDGEGLRETHSIDGISHQGLGAQLSRVLA